MTDAPPHRSHGSPSTDMTGLARRGLLSLAGAAISAFAGLAVVVLITRNVDKATAGNLFSATSLFVVLESLCALGTATGTVYFIARLRALGRPQEVRPLLRVALRPVTAVSLIAAVALYFVAPTLAEEMASDSSAATAALFIRLLAVFLPLVVVYDVAIAATQGFHTMTPTVLLEKVGRPLLQLLLLASAVLIGASWMLPVAWVAAYPVGLVCVLIALRRLIRQDEAPQPDEGGPGLPTTVDNRSFWRYTAPRGLASAAQLSLQRLDIVLVALYLGASPAAVYTAATRFVVLGQLGSQAIALAVQPKFSELIALKDWHSTQRVYRTSTAWVIAVTWPIHLLVGVFAPILLLVFGPGYEDGRWVVVLLAAAMLIATGCGMVTMLLLMAGKTAANLFNVVVALVTNITLNVVLIPRWGIIGAAVAWAAAILLSNLFPLVQIHRAFRLNPFGRGSLMVAALAVACLAVIPAVGWAAGMNPAVVVILAVGGSACYACGLWMLRGILELDDLVGSVARRLRPTQPEGGR